MKPRTVFTPLRISKICSKIFLSVSHEAKRISNRPKREENMKGTRSIMAFVFIVSALIVGSFQVSAQATDSGSSSFADSMPQIPGYNAPYPALAMQSSGKALAKPVQVVGASAALGSKGPSDGFAVAAPAIPGYNANYLSTAEMTTGSEMARTYGYAETAPAIPGYNASYPATAEIATGPQIARTYGYAETTPAIPGYNASDPVTAEIATGPQIARTYGYAGTASPIPGYNAPYPALAAQASGKVLAKPIRVTSSSSTSIAPSFYGPADGFAASVPQIPGYNAPYPALAPQNVTAP
jgi:hypothetical protein